MNTTTGQIVGAPFLIFKGIIVNAKTQEKLSGASTVSWNLTSHWGDFVQVNGRITSDHAHRALGPLGTPQRDAVFKESYLYDYGFMHAESAVNVLATYQAPEKRYKFKKSGFLGMGSGRTIEYEVMVDREVDLEFNLSAKYIPVVYGVQQVSGIPFFAEGEKNKPDKVYVNFALSEGPIMSILDISVDDNRLVCLNDKDAAERGIDSDADIPCYGTADAGFVVQGKTYVDTNEDFETLVRAGIDALEDSDDLIPEEIDILENLSDALDGLDTTSASSSAWITTGGSGIRHEFEFKITKPLTMNFTFHAGLPNQRANSKLVVKGRQKKFKIQDMYYRSMTGARYYGALHRVLDTAYVTTESTVKHTQSTLPSLEYVVKGRVLDCFNYDRSYRGTGDQSKFKLGSFVTLHTTRATGSPNNLSADAQIGSEQVQIIDKWSFYNVDGEIEYRYRFSKNLHLAEEGVVSQDIKAFYMKNLLASSDKFYFMTYDLKEVDANGDPEDGKRFGSRDIIKGTSTKACPFLMNEHAT